MSNIPTTKIVLDTRHLKGNNKYHVKLRVTFQRVQKYYPCNVLLSEKEFERVVSTTPGKLWKDTKLALEEIESKARHAIKDLPVFNFHAFETKIKLVRSGLGSVYDVFNAIIAELDDAGRIGSKIGYECACNSLKLFSPQLNFEEITPTFLERYERHLLSESKAKATVGIYTRTIRAVFNRAIRDRITSKEIYPFGNGLYQPPTGANIKKALTKSEITQIFKFKTVPGSWEERAKDFWLFTYLCNGMNLADIAQLKYENISGEEIYFERTKTIRSKRGHAQKISVVLGPHVKEIILKHGNKVKLPKGYIFPILKSPNNPVKVKKDTLQFIKQINKYMKEIADNLEINKPVTTIVARHSFATILKRSGSSIELISEALGHVDKITTKNYLASFETEERKKNMAALTTFLDDEPVKN